MEINMKDSLVAQNGAIARNRTTAEKKPKIELAKSAGFCFGVNRAVDTVQRLAGQSGKKVYTLGPIIHNEKVVEQLRQQGVRDVADISEIDDPEDSVLIIRSHGVSKQVIEELEEKGICYEDATCPFVKKIHETVAGYSAKGYTIVIIGDARHPEVQGILGWTQGRGRVVETREEAEAFSVGDPENTKDAENGRDLAGEEFPEAEKSDNSAEKVCVVAQTTFNYKKFKDLVEILSKKGYDIIAVNTICNATSTRQEEAEQLAARSDAMIVIGGTHSSNSRKLYEICKNQCESTFFIQTAEDLKTIPVSSFASLGITAGASTPNTIIQEVVEACQIRVLKKC